MLTAAGDAEGGLSRGEPGSEVLVMLGTDLTASDFKGPGSAVSADENARRSYLVIV